jgi:UTP---glucose-1-phosphate uridylyltransferase
MYGLLFQSFEFWNIMFQKLGFASCERRPGATEGVNVLIEKQNQDGLWSYGITCIEYTEFEKYGIPEPTVINGR